MIFIIPVGQSQSPLRWPWITLALIALNVLIMALTLPALDRAAALERDLSVREANLKQELFFAYEQSQGRDALQTYIGDAGNLLELQADLKSRTDEFWQRAQTEALFPTGSEQQRAIEELRTERESRQRGGVVGWLAFSPTLFRPWTLITAMFLHAGLLHLLGNMLFLWLAGPLLEDAYGRPAMLALYLAGGVVACLAWAALHRGDPTPLIGASGAISALLGADLVCFGRVRVRFWYFYWLLRLYRGSFELPAWVVLPAWALGQVFWALIARHLAMPVAFSAHLAGFAFGLLIAVALRATGWERRLVPADVLQEQAETAQMLDQAKRRPEIDAAYIESLLAAGRNEEALENLRQALAERPLLLPARVLLVSTLLELKRETEAAPEIAAVLEALVRSENAERAEQFLNEISRRLPLLKPDAALLYRLAALHERQSRYARAAERYQQVAPAVPGSPLAAKALFAAARLCREQLHDPERAAQLCQELISRFPASPQAGQARALLAEL